MKKEDIPWKHGVVLVCTNQRPDGANKSSCGRVRGEQVRRQLKQDTRANGGAAAQCRVLSSSCLDVCPENGVAVAVIPGEEIRIVTPGADDAELLAWVQEQMGRLAEGGKARRTLSRLAGKVRR
ncbi:MAG: putative metal-binding protein [Myxococcota bacterium]